VRRRTSEPAVTDEVVLGILQQLQSLDQRLGRVEELLAEAEVDRLAQAEQQDLLDLRVHSARLAAELSRVTVDLQARIDALAARSAGERPSSSPAVEVEHLPPPVEQPPSPAWEPHPDE